MKKIFLPFLSSIVSGFLLFLLISLNSCNKTISSSYHGYSLGWNNNHAYVLRVQGVWDRSSYYIDGTRDNIYDLGKIPVSAFELKKQAEIFARSRAIFTFQEMIEDYFKNLNKDEIDEIGTENQEKLVDKNIVTTTEPSVLVFSNEKMKVYYENPNRQNIQNNTLKTKIFVQKPESEVEFATISNSSSQVKQTIDFRQIYDKVDLKIISIEKIYTEDNDVNIIYLFAGRNLKQELAKAFYVSEVELRK